VHRSIQSGEADEKMRNPITLATANFARAAFVPKYGSLKAQQSTGQACGIPRIPRALCGGSFRFSGYILQTCGTKPNQPNVESTANF